MRKIWHIFLAVLLVMLLFVGCKKELSIRATDSADFFSQIMDSAEDYPQLTKEEFLEITKDYLSTGQWGLPYDKACFYTYGVDSSAYIVAGEYLFLYRGPGIPLPDCPSCCLYHYVDGVVAETVGDPLLFQDFLK